MIRAILFDKDGTLIRYDESWANYAHKLLTLLSDGDAKRHARLATAVGFDVKTKRFRAGSEVVNGTLESIYKVISAHYPDITLAQLLAADRDALADIVPIPVGDVPSLLGRLRANGYVLAMITNDHEASTHKQIAQLGWDGLFDHVICADSGFTPKPAPDMILGCAAWMGLSPDQLAMVGDSTHDLRAGRSAGVGGNIGVLSGPANISGLQAMADYVLDDIHGLTVLLETLNKEK